MIIDDPGVQLARRIGDERRSRAWSLADLATRSGVSKAMLSKIERQEVSPTATILGRIAASLDLTLAALLTGPEDGAPRFVRACDQPVWTDPATGYVRRQVFIGARHPLEMVEVDLPAGAMVAFPASTYLAVRQLIWVIEGRVDIVEGPVSTTLERGDRLEFGPPADRAYRNPTDRSCRYLVVIVRA
jgi:transcriptional regulator with XRE-family HTH domain